MNSCPSINPFNTPRITISNVVGNVNPVTGGIRDIYNRDIGKTDMYGNASLNFPKRDNLKIDPFGILRDFDNKPLGKIEGILPRPLPYYKKPYEWEKPRYETDSPIMKKEDWLSDTIRSTLKSLNIRNDSECIHGNYRSTCIFCKY